MYIPYSSTNDVLDQLIAAQSEGMLWMLCISDRHANDIPALIEGARQRDINLCGGIFPGLIEGEARRYEGIVALPLPAGSRLLTATVSREQIDWHASGLDFAPDKQSSALIFVDCQAPGITHFLGRIYTEYGNRINYAGAGAGYSDLRAEPTIFTTSGLIQNGGLLILLPHLITTNVRHGWTRVAGPFIATRTNGNVIQELNWESAGSFYRNQVEQLYPELKGKAVFPHINSKLPLAIGRPSAEDVVRDPIDINQDDEIVCLSDVPENSTIYIVTGDNQALITAASQAVSPCGTPANVSACFVSDCFSRALKLEDDIAEELGAAKEALIKFTNAPMEGVLALGEVCGNEKSSLEFYNKTFVIALLDLYRAN